MLRSGSFKTAMPIYLKSRPAANLSDNPIREDKYGSLLRVLQYPRGAEARARNPACRHSLCMADDVGTK